MERDIEAVAAEIVDAAVKLHVRLGPGLPAPVYLTLLALELERRGLCVERQKQVALEYEGAVLDQGLRIDLLVEDCVVVEVKAMEKLAQVHWRQVLTYLRLAGLQLGLLLNFGAATMREGIHRIVNGYRPLPGSPLRINQEGSARVTHQSREDTE